VTLPPIAAAKGNGKPGRGSKKGTGAMRSRALSDVSETQPLIQNRKEAQSVQSRLKPYVPVKLSFAPRPSGLHKSQSQIFQVPDLDDDELEQRNGARGILTHSVSVPSLMKKSQSTLGFAYEHAASSNDFSKDLRRRLFRQSVETSSIQVKISKIIASEGRSTEKNETDRTPELSRVQWKSKKIVELNKLISSWNEVGGFPKEKEREKRAQTPSIGPTRTSSIASVTSTTSRARSPLSKDRLPNTMWDQDRLIPVITGRLSLCRTSAHHEDLAEESYGTAIRIIRDLLDDEILVNDLSPLSVIAFCKALRKHEVHYWTDHLVLLGGETELDFTRSAVLLAVYLVLLRGYSVENACEPFLQPRVCHFKKVYDRNGEWLECYNIKNVVSSLCKAHQREFFTLEGSPQWLIVGADIESSFELLQACPKIYLFRVKDSQLLDLAEVKEHFKNLQVGEIIRIKEMSIQSKDDKFPWHDHLPHVRVQDVAWSDKIELQYIFKDAHLSTTSQVLQIESRRSKETCAIGYVLITDHGFSVEEVVCWLYNTRPSSVAKSDILFLESVFFKHKLEQENMTNLQQNK